MGIVAGLVALAGPHLGTLVLGSAAGTALESALPWLTRLHQARKAARMLRSLRSGRQQPITRVPGSGSDEQV